MWILNTAWMFWSTACGQSWVTTVRTHATFRLFRSRATDSWSKLCLGRVGTNSLLALAGHAPLDDTRRLRSWRLSSHCCSHTRATKSLSQSRKRLRGRSVGDVLKSHLLPQFEIARGAAVK